MTFTPPHSDLKRFSSFFNVVFCMKPFIHFHPFGCHFLFKPFLLALVQSLRHLKADLLDSHFGASDLHLLLEPRRKCSTLVNVSKPRTLENGAGYPTVVLHSDNEAWSYFGQKITQEMQEKLKDSKSPETTAHLSKGLDLIFLKTKIYLLHGASKNQLRIHFQQWAADAFPAKNPQAIQGLPRDSPFQSYHYVIQIDDNALHNINKDPQTLWLPTREPCEFCGYLLEIIE